MNWLDKWYEKSARRVARGSSRRSFLSKLGATLVGAAGLPLLPVARGAALEQSTVPDDATLTGPVGDPQSCDYWRHCAMDGYLCSCCGGSHTTCPPGTEMAPITWIGTCRNPGDDKDYIISYNDCCGKLNCARCMCGRNEGDKAIYYPAKSNDIVWCFGTQNNLYHCTTALVVGVAMDD